MKTLALGLRSFGVAFADQVILGAVTFELQATGLTVLVGPAGSGKSTLLRTLAGLNDCHPSLNTWGTVSLGGATYENTGAGVHRFEPETQRPALVMQHARFFLDTVRENLVSALPNRADLERLEQTLLVTVRLESMGLTELIPHLSQNAVELPMHLQRRLAIARALMAEPRVIFADEPTVGLDDDDATGVIALLRRQGLKRAVLLVTHNQRYAVAAGGTTLLMAGGRIQDSAPTQEFFAKPQSEVARHFLRTGGCIAASPDVPEEHLIECATPATTMALNQEVRSRFVGPRGFFWVIPGRLGGMPRPGIIDALEHDIEGLKRLGVTLLVTLEESPTVDAVLASKHGISVIHFPIVDMAVPKLASAVELCHQLADAMRAGDIVAMHCRAGLGRTGTLLACQLIEGGETARGALDTVRAIHPRCVQTLAQVDFLRSFANALGEQAADRAQAAPRQRSSITHPPNRR